MILALVFALAQWVEGSVIGINPDNPKGPLAIYIARDQPGWLDGWAVPLGLQVDRWNTVTLPVPVDAKAVFLSGLLVITHPMVTTWSYPGGTCEVRATFRAPGSAHHEDNFQIQALEAHTGGGVRSTVATWAPVTNRQVEFFYRMTPGCPSLINLSLQAYLR
jgi:hypothetical protein